METAIEVLGAMIATAAVAGAASIGLALRRASRANRLVPDTASSAPLSWRWSPSAAARLHRRLRRTCRMVRAATDPLRPARRPRRQRRSTGSPFLGLADELVREALTLDRRLLVAERAPVAWRRDLLGPLGTDVAALEAAAVRLVGLIDTWQHRVTPGGASSDTVIDLDARIHAVEVAIDELSPAERPWPTQPAT